MSDEIERMTFQLFHPRGVKVTFSFPEPPDALGAVSEYLDKGWLVNAPGLEAGEEREEIGWVCRGEKGDGVPFVLLYANQEQMTHSILKVYLNTDEDVKNFEFASGLRLDAMPLYEGSDKPERGKNAKADQKIVKMKKPFGIVYKPNPKFVQADADAARAANKIYKQPKRLLARYADERPKAAQEPRSSDETPSGIHRKVTPQNATEQAWAVALETAALQGEAALMAKVKELPPDENLRQKCRQLWPSLLAAAKDAARAARQKAVQEGAF